MLSVLGPRSQAGAAPRLPAVLLHCCWRTRCHELNFRRLERVPAMAKRALVAS